MVVGDRVIWRWNMERIGKVIAINNGIVTVQWLDNNFKARYYDYDLQLVN